MAQEQTKPNFFDVVKKMVDSDNKECKVSTNLVGAKMVKAGGIIEMGVDEATRHAISKMMMFGTNRKRVLLFVIDEAEYAKTEATFA